MKGGNVDDAPPSLPHHFGHECLSEKERRGKVEPQRIFPNLGRKFVPRLARIQPGGIDDEAAKYIPLDRLCLSPQCGFASCEIGNKLTEEQQWAKLALVKEIAEEVWK